MVKQSNYLKNTGPTNGILGMQQRPKNKHWTSPTAANTWTDKYATLQ